MHTRRRPDRIVLLPALLVAAIGLAASQVAQAQEAKPTPAVPTEKATQEPEQRQTPPPSEQPSAKPAPPIEKAEQTPKQQQPDTSTTEPSAKPAPKEQKKPEPAMKGYCPVAYLLLGKATKGNPAYQSKYVGEVYYFHSAEAKEKFDADPEKYLPQFGGLCTTALGGMYGNRLTPDPEVFEVVNGKVYLFWSERAKNAYELDPEGYLANAAARFSTPALEGHCPVSYQTRNKAIKCPPVFSSAYKGWVYYFTNPRVREVFREDPKKFAPKYRGYCAEGVSRNKRYPADPTHFAVRGGRTYLFYDAKAKLTFRAHPEETIQHANANWVTLKDKVPH